MGVAKPFDAFSAEFESSFTKKLVGEQATAHANLAMDAPDRQFDPLRIERLLPGKDMLIHAINKRAVEIKQEDRFDTHAIFPHSKMPVVLNADWVCSNFNHLIAAPVDDRLQQE